ncbi:DUF6226 family protein [Actinoplanes sp. CA-015351]|uniref:DUF6226 family protein n=1 Tax=Actinoplanes sp. CA-015351 TaxID=3239897 RepID=UPI003D965B14
MGELRQRVNDHYNAEHQPSWPNPHPGGGPTEDESEYSRVTDPDRYRIVHARVRSWIAVLTSLPGIAFSSDGVLTSAAPGALPLHVAWPGPFAVRISAGRLDPAADPIPDCGCDACDFGSDDLLEAIDTAVLELIDGDIVLLDGPGWHARWFSFEDGRNSVGGGLDFRTVEGWCERLAAGRDVSLPTGTSALVGRRFLGAAES